MHRKAREIVLICLLITASLSVVQGSTALAAGVTRLTQDVTATSLSHGETLSVQSVAVFDEFGGEAVFEPGTDQEEEFMYDGIDKVSNELFGITRGSGAIDHSVGTFVEALGPKPGAAPRPGADPPSQPPADPPQGDAGQTTVIEDGTSDAGGELLGSPSSTWMNNHCVSTGSANSLHPVYVYDGINDPGTSADDTRVTDPISKIRDEIQAADRAIAQSHGTFKQHMRIACTRNLFTGAWTNIDVTSYSVPATAEVNQPIDGYLDCGEVLSHMENSSPYGRSASTQTDRHYSYLDTSLAGTSCSFGWSDALDNNAPGTSNPNNSVYGDASSDYAEWSASGVSNRSVMVTLQEFHHSLGLVADGTAVDGGPSTKTPSNCCGSHSRDEVDFMNGGYCRASRTPDCTDGQNILTTCSKPAAVTYKDSYADCGRQDYWAPSAGTSNFLCTHYNLAWDSLYYHQRATPTSGCR